MDPLFWELHSGLPHEAPGGADETLRALALTGLAGPLDVLDIASGPGAASLALAGGLPGSRLVASDLHPPFLAAAAARLQDAGHGNRFAAVAADMAALPFAPGAFDLLWCEGAAYILGVGEALARWRPLVRAGGRIAFTEAVWLTRSPAEAARALWAEYPAMTCIEGTRARAAGAGWRVVADFLLPEAAWQNYYRPLEARRAALADAHGADHPVLAETAREIAVRRAHGGDYGYAFFVAAPV